jgi:predicted RND superfamily exporter protein
MLSLFLIFLQLFCLIAVASFAALYFADINPIIVLGFSALIGVVCY